MNNKGQQWAIAVMAALTAATATTTAIADSSTGPQCYGIAKEGRNACGTVDHKDKGVLVKGHACAGLATDNANCYEWLPIPAPLCPKFVVTINGKDYSGFTSPTACLTARGEVTPACPPQIILEKCYGITKKTVTPNWINVPEGSCVKIKGGKLGLTQK